VLGELVEHVLAEGDGAPFGVFRVLLDEEAFPVGVEFRGQLSGDAGDGDDAGVEVDVFFSEFDELAPAQPGFDVGLDQQLQLAGGDRVVEGAELVGGDDPAPLGGDGRGLHAHAGVQEGDLVIQSRGEDRGQDGHGVADRRRLNSADLQFVDPFADVGRENVDHPELGEGRHDVPVQGVGVVLAGGQLHEVVGEPDVFDLTLEQVRTLVGLATASFGDFRFGLLPGRVRGLQAGERAGGAAWSGASS
jgi:hypothetical protein